MKKLSTLLFLVVLFALQAAAQADPASFADYIDFSKYYTISTPTRGGFAVNTTSLISTNQERQAGTDEVIPSDPNDPNQAFQFVQDPNDETKVYLYAPAVAKYVDNSGALQSSMEKASPIYLFLLTSSFPENPFGLSFNEGSFSLVPQINNYYQIVVNGWGNPDEGNCLKFGDSNFKADDALSSQIEATNDQINGFAQLPVLFPESEINNALDATATAESTADLQNIIKNLEKSASGKNFSLYSNFSTGENSTEDGVRPLGYINDNGTTYVNDSLSFASEFQLIYNDSADAYALKNVFTGNYLKSIPQSTHASLDTVPYYIFKVIPQGENLVSIGVSGGEFLHNGFKATGIVGWFNDADDSKWVIADFDGSKAAKGSLASLESKVGSHWGDYKDTQAFEDLKSEFIANPSSETYKALLASPDLVGSEGFVNIINTSENGQGNSISIIDKAEPGVYNLINGLGTDNEDPNQLWVVTSVKPGYVRLYSPNAQLYIGGNQGGSSAACIGLQAEPHDWQITWRNDTTFVLSDNGGNMNFETGGDANPQDYGNLNQFAGSDTWVAHEIKTVTLPVNKYGEKAYGTACYPFSITLPDNVKAYNAKLADDGKTIDLIEIGNTIPAGQPAVISTENSDDDVIATINGSETSPVLTQEGRLSGSYLPFNVNKEDSILTLGQENEVPGFYHNNSTIINGAFFPTASEAADGYALSGNTVTGINKIQNDEVSVNAKRYNLAGQRVDKNYKGVVIVNGKKLIQK